MTESGPDQSSQPSPGETVQPPKPTVASSRPLKALLSSSVDYAGMFPPAGLSLGRTMERYAVHRRSERAWMLGGLVVPWARLRDLGASRAESADEEVWSLNILIPEAAVSAPGELATTAAELAVLRVRLADRFSIGALEVPPLPSERIDAVAKVLPADIETFYEVSLTSNVSHCLNAVARAGACAKVRTGGVTSDKIPSSRRLAEFIVSCADAGVPFKATAGLHHPLRAEQCLTYEPDSDRAVMHGFLNVAVAACLADHGADVTRVAEVLEEGSPGRLEIEEKRLCWDGQCYSVPDLERFRRQFFRSFGSCSFEEPVHDLEELGLL